MVVIMKREDLGANLKEKLLFEGLSGDGKTYTSLLLSIRGSNSKQKF